MKTAEAVKKAMQDKKELKDLIVQFVYDYSKNLFIEASLNKSKSDEILKKSNLYLAAVGELHSYAVLKATTKNLEGEGTQEEMNKAVIETAAKPMMDLLVSTREKAIDDVIREYDEMRGQPSKSVRKA